MTNKDFGCVFYTTLLEDQAWRMAQRRTKIDGGVPTVTVYEIPDDIFPFGRMKIVFLYGSVLRSDLPTECLTEKCTGNYHQ